MTDSPYGLYLLAIGLSAGLSFGITPAVRALAIRLHLYDRPHGIKAHLHSCGDIRKAVPQVLEAGFDCLQPMEAKAGCDVLEFAREYGDRLAYMGNINVVQLSTNDPVRVQEEIEPKLRELKRMRIPYVFHSDHSIPPNIDLKTYQHALSVFREHCRYA